MLQIGNVRELLVPLDHSIEGYLCSKWHIPSVEPVCPLEDEEPIPIADLVNVEITLEERGK